MKRRTKRKITLGELIYTVGRYAANDVELDLAVADLIKRGDVSFGKFKVKVT